MNKRYVTRRLAVVLSSEAASATAAQLGFASLAQVSNAIGANGVMYAGAVSDVGDAVKFYTDGAGAAWTGASPTLSTTLYFTVTGIALEQ